MVLYAGCPSNEMTSEAPEKLARDNRNGDFEWGGI